jgi:hypothetical protein
MRKIKHKNTRSDQYLWNSEVSFWNTWRHHLSRVFLRRDSTTTCLPKGWPRASKLYWRCLGRRAASATNSWSLSVSWRSDTLHTSSKLRQRVMRASMRCHISCRFGSHLLVEVGSDATMCPAVPPWWGELQCCHVSHDSMLCLPKRWAPVLSCVPRFRALPSWEGSSGAATCPTAPGGLWTTGIKKCLAALVT